MHVLSASLKILITYKNDDNQEVSDYISPSSVKDLFRKISPEDCRFMGFNYPEIKPEYMILSEIPVRFPRLSHAGASSRGASACDAPGQHDAERGRHHLRAVEHPQGQQGHQRRRLPLSLFFDVALPRQGKERNGRRSGDAADVLQQLLR